MFKSELFTSPDAIRVFSPTGMQMESKELFVRRIDDSDNESTRVLMKKISGNLRLLTVICERADKINGACVWLSGACFVDATD